MKKNDRKRTLGFSVIELIIVIAIMAILVAFIAPKLIGYMEKTRAAKDYNSLDALYSAYSAVVAETDDPGKITLTDTRVLDNIGFASLTDFENHFESEQFKDAEISCYYDASNREYGICMVGENGYTGVQIDSKGTKCVLGQKGKASDYVDENTKRSIQLSNS